MLRTNRTFASEENTLARQLCGYQEGVLWAIMLPSIMYCSFVTRYTECFSPVLLKNKNLMCFHLLLSFSSRENVIAGSHFQEVKFGRRKETNFLL